MSLFNKKILGEDQNRQAKTSFFQKSDAALGRHHAAVHKSVRSSSADRRVRRQDQVDGPHHQQNRENDDFAVFRRKHSTNSTFCDSMRHDHFFKVSATPPKSGD